MGNQVSLKRHLIELNKLRDKLNDERDRNYNRQFDALRAFQHEAIGQHSHFLTVEEYRSRHDELEQRLATYIDRIEKLEGRRIGRADLWGWIVAGVGIVIAIMTLLVTHFNQ